MENSLLSTVHTPEFDQIYIKKCGFYAFFRQVWPLIEPSTTLIDNWHIKVICEKLDEIVRDRQKGIGSSTVFAVPPGSTKSNIISVALQPYVWTIDPGKQFITTTYEASLAEDLSGKSRRIVESKWYQERWPIKLIKETDKFWSNTQGGFRRACGVGGPATGKHAHYIIGDDLIKEQLSRQGKLTTIANHMRIANDFFHGTLATRKIGDPVRILVGQRLHTLDPPGVAMREHDYKSVVFPVHFDPLKADPLDPRTEEGELICPQKDDEKTWKKVAKSLGPTASAAQLEQNPEKLGGSLLKKEWLAHRYTTLPYEIARTIKTQEIQEEQIWASFWDLTFKGKETSDRVCGQIWCSFQAHFYLIDQVLDIMGFKKTLEEIKKLLDKYPFIKAHYMEDAANAPAAEDVLVDEIPGIQLLSHRGGTLARTQAIEGIWEAGQVILPQNAPFMLDFLKEHLAFDGSGLSHDDTVSASSLAIGKLSDRKGADEFIDAMNGVRCHSLLKSWGF